MEDLKQKIPFTNAEIMPLFYYLSLFLGKVRKLKLVSQLVLLSY